MSARIAGAPISWGVCEVPGWGEVLPAERVLAEMASLGLTATELGPSGFLPEEAGPLRVMLGSHGLTLAAGFVAVVLHDPAAHAATLAEVHRACALLAGAGGEVLVVAAATGRRGYDTRPVLADDAWSCLVATLDDVAAAAQEHGLTATLHPHVGCHVETAPEVERFLADSTVPLCLDTGHLLIGGIDPVDLARRYGHRVAHVHLKDVDAGVAARVRSGEVGYARAVSTGLYRPLGQGDADVLGVVRTLRGAGYDGWWVLEQDTALPPAGDTSTPVHADYATGHRPLRDTAASISFLRAELSPETLEKETP